MKRRGTHIVTRRPVRALLVLALIMIVCEPNPRVGSAHQDQIFRVLPTGEVAGIPKKYGPVFVHTDADAKKPTATVRIGSRSHRLPACLASLFRLPPGESIRVVGSWWHDRSQWLGGSDLPPYLVLELPRRSSRHGFFTGHALMFNLEDGSLINVEERNLVQSGSGETRRDVELRSLCSSSDMEQLPPALKYGEPHVPKALRAAARRSPGAETRPEKKPRERSSGCRSGLF